MRTDFTQTTSKVRLSQTYSEASWLRGASRRRPQLQPTLRDSYLSRCDLSVSVRGLAVRPSPQLDVRRATCCRNHALSSHFRVLRKVSFRQKWASANVDEGRRMFPDRWGCWSKCVFVCPSGERHHHHESNNTQQFQWWLLERARSDWWRIEAAGWTHTSDLFNIKVHSSPATVTDKRVCLISPNCVKTLGFQMTCTSRGTLC